MKVLHIDDSKLVRTMVAKMLTSAGHVVDSAEDGASGLAAASRNRYDVAVVDLMLPDMTGIDIVRTLRSDRRTARLPVLICSSVQQRSMVEEAVKAGIQDYMLKPIDGQALIDKVQRLGGALIREPIPDIEGSMARLGVPGDMAFFAEAVRDFVGQSREDVDELRQCLEAGSADRIAVLLSRLQGDARNLGAEVFDEQVSSLAPALATGGPLDPEAYALLMERLEELEAFSHDMETKTVMPR
ncbi:MAG: response regulator [Armatimonadia bacterium]|nr:response regulator [Armatimonadia bacterium]